MRCVVILGMALSLVAVASANAGTQATPEIFDQAGDANGAGQALPAGVDSLDIRRVWFSAPYQTVKELGADGSVKAVRYIPSALTVNIETQGPKNDTALGIPPRLVRTWQVRADLPTCHGTASKALFRFSLGQGGSKTGSFFPCTGTPIMADATTTTGSVDSLSFEVAKNPWLVRGLSFGLGPDGAVTLSAASFLRPIVTTAIDEDLDGSGVWENGHVDSAAGTKAYIFASDVPADVDCTTSPNHVDCI